MMPQSSTNVTRSTRTRLRLSTETSVTWALCDRKLLAAMPRARPSGSGYPSRRVRQPLQGLQGAWVVGQQIVAQVDLVATDGDGELVER